MHHGMEVAAALLELGAALGDAEAEFVEEDGVVEVVVNRRVLGAPTRGGQ